MLVCLNQCYDDGLRKQEDLERKKVRRSRSSTSINFNLPEIETSLLLSLSLTFSLSFSSLSKNKIETKTVILILFGLAQNRKKSSSKFHHLKKFYLSRSNPMNDCIRH